MSPKLSASLRVVAVVAVVTLSALDMLPHGIKAVRDYLEATDTSTSTEE